MAEDLDLSAFAGDVAPSFQPAYGGGYNLGLNLQPAVTPEFTPSSILPDLPPEASKPWYSGAADFAGKVGTGLGKEVSDSPLKAFSSALGLGATGLGISNQLRTGQMLQKQTQNIEHQQKAAEAAAAPAVSFGKETLDAARGGQLPGPMQAAVEQWKQQAKADMRARLAAMGLGNSTDIQSEEAKIDLMAESMKAQLLQGQEQVGLEGLQTGVNAATQGAQVSSQQQQLLTQLISGANQQLAQLNSAQR